MGYPSLGEIIDSARDLTYKEADRQKLIRTSGFWHVLIFLRHCRLNGRETTFTLNTYSLAEACFDLNGIDLPIKSQSRAVYYEPGATQGVDSSKLFRHREGPRQTYLNRIYDGLIGGGSRKPKLFVANAKEPPVTVSLAQDWVDVLRSNPNHCLFLDERFESLITWVFRFGVPRNNGETVSIARHSDNGVLEARNNLELESLPQTSNDICLCLQDYLGLDDDAFQNLLPEQNRQTQLPLVPQALQANFRSETYPLAFSLLGEGMREEFLSNNTQEMESNADVDSAEQLDPDDAMTNVQTGEASENYIVNWSDLTTQFMNLHFLIGVENSIARCLAAIRAGKFVILMGAPGTGKTDLAKQLCLLAMQHGVPGYITATATAEWSTFETIGGYLPDTENSGQLKFTKNFFTEALSSGKWLIVDELNRADIDKAFGELFTLFSGEKVQLAFRQDGKPIVLVPPGVECDELVETPIYQQVNWRMLGTMNTFDKASLFQLSYAFMRRFAFVEIPVPSQSDYKNILNRHLRPLKQSAGETFSDECSKYLEAIFAPRADEGLSEIGLNVGPAIAIDIIKFLQERCLLEEEQSQPPDPQKLVLEGIEMYLYPQFEGKDRYHLKIVELIEIALVLSDEAGSSTSRYLAVWTGYEA